eukprot:3032608-Rhodomonas_salina.1
MHSSPLCCAGFDKTHPTTPQKQCCLRCRLPHTQPATLPDKEFAILARRPPAAYLLDVCVAGQQDLDHVIPPSPCHPHRPSMLVCVRACICVCARGTQSASVCARGTQSARVPECQSE